MHIGNMKYGEVIDIREYMNSREKENEVYMRYTGIYKHAYTHAYTCSEVIDIVEVLCESSRN